jgi:YD repeat-containing protein
MSDTPWVDVSGDNGISAYRYDAERMRLEVRLPWGSSGAYEGVSATAFRFFESSPLKGHHLAKVVRPVHTYEDLGRWR